MSRLIKNKSDKICTVRPPSTQKYPNNDNSTRKKNESKILCSFSKEIPTFLKEMLKFSPFRRCDLVDWKFGDIKTREDDYRGVFKSKAARFEIFSLPCAELLTIS